MYAKPEPVRLSAAVQKRLKRQARRRRKAAGAVAVTHTAVRQAGLRAVLDQSLEPLSMCSVDAGDPMRVPAPFQESE